MRKPCRAHESRQGGRWFSCRRTGKQVDSDCYLKCDEYEDPDAAQLRIQAGGHVVWEGGGCWLSPAEAKLLAFLLAGDDVLIDELCRDPYNVGATRASVRHTMSSLRRKLREAGCPLKIANRRSYGHFLVPADCVVPGDNSERRPSFIPKRGS